MTLKIWGALGLLVFASWISWTMSLDSSSSAHASEQQADFIPLF